MPIIYNYTSRGNGHEKYITCNPILTIIQEKPAMNSKQPTEEENNIICTCTGTTEEKVKQLIANGKDDLDKIASATGASTGCGSCDMLILEILERQSTEK